MADANTGTAAPDSQQQDTNDDAAPVTLGQLRALFGEWTAAQRTENARAMNAAITSRLKAVKATEPAQEPAQTQPAETKGAQGVDPELAKLRAQLDDLKRRNEETERRALETAHAARRKEQDAAVLAALQAQGLTPARARAVLNDQRATGAIGEDADNNFVWTVPFASQRGQRPVPVQFTSLEDAVDAWRKSPDAAEFLPAAPPQMNGSQPRVGQRPQTGASSAQIEAQRRVARMTGGSVP